MLTIQRKISPYNFSSRNGTNIKYIVLHYTGNKDDTALNNATYFYNGDRQVSAHYFVDDISIWQSVEDSKQRMETPGMGPARREPAMNSPAPARISGRSLECFSL